MSKCKINCTRVSQPSSKITITNVIFLHFVNSKESFCRGNSKMTHTCCALDIKVKKCKLCHISVLSENLFIDFQDCTQTLFIQGFTKTVFYWNFTQTLAFGRLWPWTPPSLFLALSLSLLLTAFLPKCHILLFLPPFSFPFAATEQKEEPVTWGQRSQRSHRCFDTWNAIWNIKPDVMFFF